MSLNKRSKLLNFINARMRVTIQDSRVLVGTFMAFDKHMNLVLGDCEEHRRIKARKAGGGGVEDRDEKRMLGLVLLRGENVVSIQIESMPRAAKGAAGTGPGSARPAGRGAGTVAAAAPAGLAGPVRGVGGATIAPVGGVMPGAAAARPGFPGAMPPGAPAAGRGFMMPPGMPMGMMPPMGMPPGMMPPGFAAPRPM